MKKNLLAVLVVLIVCALVFALQRKGVHAPQGPRGVGVTLDEVRPGLSQEETLRALGRADCSGPLKVSDGMGSYAEYGASHLTWNGHPTLTFTASKRVLAVIGNTLRKNGASFSVGALEDDAIRVLGPPRHRERTSLVYDLAEGRLVVMIDNAHVTRLLWSSAR